MLGRRIEECHIDACPLSGTNGMETGIPAPDDEDSGQGLWLRRVHTNRNARLPEIFWTALEPALTGPPETTAGQIVT